METTIDFFEHLQSLDDLVRWGGYVTLFLIIFAETGLFVGFLLPGDSLLITAGLVASRGHLDLGAAILTMTAAAILGDSTGYLIGKRIGSSLFQKQYSTFFDPGNLHKAQAFYDKHGGKTIFFARFLPVIRSFSSPVAGIARMPYSKFLFYSASGATVWIPFFTLLGFFLGTWLAKYYWLINLILSATLAFIIFSILYHIFKLKFTRKHV